MFEHAQMVCEGVGRGKMLEHAASKNTADHRRHLEYMFRLRWQPIQTGGDNHLNGCRNVEFGFVSKTDAATPFDEYARIVQTLDDLLNKKRVATRPLEDCLCQ